jgi:hypothetical protein
VSGPPITESTTRQVAVHPRRVDWFRIVVDLERSGMSQAAIGLAIGRSSAQVFAYKSIPDTEPPFHHAMMLLGLWEERVGGGRAVPFVR